MDILEYCSPEDLIKTEQYYIQALKPDYNILKTAGSLLGFKHSEATIEIIRNAKLEKKRSQTRKLQIEKGNSQSQSVFVLNNITGEERVFTSIRKAAKYVNKHPLYLSKCIRNVNVYRGGNFLIKPINK